MENNFSGKHIYVSSVDTSNPLNIAISIFQNQTSRILGYFGTVEITPMIRWNHSTIAPTSEGFNIFSPAKVWTKNDEVDFDT